MSLVDLLNVVNFTHRDLSAGASSVWVGCSFVVSVYYGHRWLVRVRRDGWDEVAKLYAGIALVSLALLMSKPFWLMYSWIRGFGYEDFSAVILSMISTWGPVVAMVALTGYVFHLSLPLKRWFGRAWILVTMIFYILTFLFGAFADDLLRRLL